jgi:F0F1-type ATP synthase assembly protein I
VFAGRIKQSDVWRQVAIASGLGFVLFASIGGGYLLGWLLDRWLGTAPILGLIVAGIGMAGGLIEILQIMKRVEKSGRGEANGSSEN